MLRCFFLCMTIHTLRLAIARFTLRTAIGIRPALMDSTLGSMNGPLDMPFCDTDALGSGVLHTRSTPMSSLIDILAVCDRFLHAVEAVVRTLQLETDEVLRDIRI